MAEYMQFRMAIIGVIVAMFALTNIVGKMACGMASFILTKGAPSMMDCLMVVTLLFGFSLVWTLVNWCQRQIDSQE